MPSNMKRTGHVKPPKQCLLVARNNMTKQYKRRKEKKEDNNKWAHIPDDVLERIMKCLSLKDYLRLRAICSTWRTVVSNAIATQHCHPLPELATIFLCSREPTVCNLTTEGELTQKRINLNQMCHGTVEGWLIVSEGIVGPDKTLSINFFNPVTMTRSALVPPVLNSPIPKEVWVVNKIVASSKPDSLKPSDCFLVCLISDYCHIAFCRLTDKSWTIIEAAEIDKELRFRDMDIIGSKLYVTTNQPMSSILVYNLQQQDYSDEPPKPKELAKLPPIISPNQGLIFKRNLAKDDVSQELFLIVTGFVIMPKITLFEVFRLDTKKETNEWVRVHDLGDIVLFISQFKSMVISRATLNSSTKEVIARNSIYFAFLDIRSSSDSGPDIHLGKICLTDNNIQHFSLDKSCHPMIPFPIWFVPSV